VRAAWLSIVACACGNGTPAESKSQNNEPAKPAATSLEGVKVTRDGKPVAIAHAYSKKLGLGERYQLLLTSKDSSCPELVDNLFNKRDGEQTLLFDLGERLAPDGTLSGVVTQLYDPHGITIDPGSKASAKGSEFSIDLEAKAGSAAFASVHGTFKAEDCGLHPREDSGLPKAKHPSTATIEIAGKRLPLVGAVVVKDNVLLSTAPKACDGWLPTAQVMIWRAQKLWSVRGEWFDGETGNHALPDENTKDIKIERGAAGTSDDGPTVQLTVSGKGTIGKYPVTLAGTIEALDCKDSALL